MHDHVLYTDSNWGFYVLKLCTRFTYVLHLLVITHLPSLCNFFFFLPPLIGLHHLPHSRIGFWFPVVHCGSTSISPSATSSLQGSPLTDAIGLFHWTACWNFSPYQYNLKPCALEGRTLVGCFTREGFGRPWVKCTFDWLSRAKDLFRAPVVIFLLIVFV